MHENIMKGESMLSLYEVSQLRVKKRITVMIIVVLIGLTRILN